MTAPHYADATVTLYAGDCLDVLRELPDASVDSVCTDPPYGLEFMGKEWDAPWKQGADVHAKARDLRADEMTDENKRRFIAAGVNKFAAGFPFQEWCQLWATECLRVLKPGGHLLAFGGTRTWHRLACAVEDAGFEVRDSIAWLYGSGFPKSLDVSKAIDKAAGAEREVSGERGNTQCPYLDRGEDCPGHDDAGQSMSGATVHRLPTAPATDAARQWQGWGTALKPAFEPVVVARKPLAGTVAQTVLAHGTGALNIDGCRVSTNGEVVATPQSDPSKRQSSSVRISPQDDVDAFRAAQAASIERTNTLGRWPANVVLDEHQAAALDQQSGETVSRANAVSDERVQTESSSYGIGQGRRDPLNSHTDKGGASRFFYTAKAANSERVRVNGTAHPTVKPLDLMRWLVRLVTPPGGTVLEPFAGSGTTVEACILEGFRCVAIEREADYLPLIVQRINRRRDPVAAIRDQGEDGGLFDLLDGGAA